MAASIALLPSAQLWSKHRFLLDAPWDQPFPSCGVGVGGEALGSGCDSAHPRRQRSESRVGSIGSSPEGMTVRRPIRIQSLPAGGESGPSGVLWA
jgi:hypothetical protein